MKRKKQIKESERLNVKKKSIHSNSQPLPCSFPSNIFGKNIYDFKQLSKKKSYAYTDQCCAISNKKGIANIWFILRKQGVS